MGQYRHMITVFRHIFWHHSAHQIPALDQTETKQLSEKGIQSFHLGLKNLYYPGFPFAIEVLRPFPPERQVFQDNIFHIDRESQSRRS